MADRVFSIEDALVYLDKIKCAYMHKPDVYGRFLAIMKEFKLHIIKSEEVIRRVSNLFVGNEHLTFEFSHFLPCEIDLPHNAVKPNAPEEAPAQMQQAHAMSYVIKVRNRFIHHPMVYSRFLDVLNVYHSKQQTVDEVLEQVAVLFADQTDLLCEFAYFLPPSAQDQAKRRMDEAVRAFESRRVERTVKEKAALQQQIQLAQQEVLDPHPVTPPRAVSDTPSQIAECECEAFTRRVSPRRSAEAQAPAKPQAPNIVEPAHSPSKSASLSKTNVSTASSSSSDSTLSTSDGSESSDGFEEIPPEQVNIKNEPSTQPAPQYDPARSAPMTRSAATCFQPSPGDTSNNPPRATRKRRIFEFSQPAPLTRSKATHTSSPSNIDRAQSSAAPAAHASLPQKSTSLNVQCLWSRSVQMSSALADMDRRLHTMECMMDMQRKRIESQHDQILELKSLLNGKKRK